MAIGYGSGETRCIDAAKHAISSPLLETDIEGATGVLYNVTGSSNLTLTETSDAAEIIRAAVDEDADIIYGTSIDESMGDAVMITLIATGFPIGNQRWTSLLNGSNIASHPRGTRVSIGSLRSRPGLDLHTRARFSRTMILKKSRASFAFCESGNHCSDSPRIDSETAELA